MEELFDRNLVDKMIEEFGKEDDDAFVTKEIDFLLKRGW